MSRNFLVPAIAAVALIALSAPAWCQSEHGNWQDEQQGDGGSFEQHKEMMIQRLEHRIAEEQRQLSCVRDAQDQGQLQSCRGHAHHDHMRPQEGQ